MPEEEEVRPPYVGGWPLKVKLGIQVSTLVDVAVTPAVVVSGHSGTTTPHCGVDAKTRTPMFPSTILGD